MTGKNRHATTPKQHQDQDQDTEKEENKSRNATLPRKRRKQGQTRGQREEKRGLCGHERVCSEHGTDEPAKAERVRDTNESQTEGLNANVEEERGERGVFTQRPMGRRTRGEGGLGAKRGRSGVCRNRQTAVESSADLGPDLEECVP